MEHEKSKRKIGYTKFEELLNSITHGIGVLFGVVALSILLYFAIRKQDTKSIVVFTIYGVCLITMYLCSTLYHSFKDKKTKKILRVFDHSSIYLFIAGTYTPVLALTMDGILRIAMLLAIWTIAILGVIFKVMTFKKMDKFKFLSLSIYIGMGWLAIFTIKPIIEMTSINFFLWILGGGLIYTLGTIFYSFKKIPYNHAIWHLFVLAASVVHFLGIVIHLA